VYFHPTAYFRHSHFALSTESIIQVSGMEERGEEERRRGGEEERGERRGGERERIPYVG